MEITFEHVSHIYQPNTPFAFHALKDLSFHIPSGSYTAIIGHTGSGKSTLIQHLNGLLIPTEGRVKVGDFQLEPGKKNKHMKDLRKHVGVVFQYPEHQLFEETVKKDLMFGPLNFGTAETTIEKRIPEILEAVQLPDEVLDRSPFDLSGGQMRRVAIAGILMMDPNVLVLDEPTAGLDPGGRREMMDMFYNLHKEKEMTTILVTHSMEDAMKYADYVLIMNEGRLYMEGQPEEVLIQKKKLEAVGLDVPEMVEFLSMFEEKFGTKIPFHGQNIKELASDMLRVMKWGKCDE